jgi:Protein of unknown function (DUF1573)
VKNYSSTFLKSRIVGSKTVFTILFSVLISSVLHSCNSKKTIEFAKKTENLDAPKIVFESPKHDFGEINEGQIVSHTYKFKNKGTMPLEIIAVNVSCGCTVAEKPEKPIGIGKDGEIKVSFNSAGKVGINTKHVTVLSNASNASEDVTFDVIVNKINQ